MYLGVLRYNADERHTQVPLWGPDVLATGTQTLSVTILGSKSTAEADPWLQTLMIFFIPEGTRLGCTAAIPVTFIGIREN